MATRYVRPISSTQTQFVFNIDGLLDDAYLRNRYGISQIAIENTTGSTISIPSLQIDINGNYKAVTGGVSIGAYGCRWLTVQSGASLWNTLTAKGNITVTITGLPTGARVSLQNGDGNNYNKGIKMYFEYTSAPTTAFTAQLLDTDINKPMRVSLTSTDANINIANITTKDNDVSNKDEYFGVSNISSGYIVTLPPKFKEIPLLSSVSPQNNFVFYSVYKSSFVEENWFGTTPKYTTINSGYTLTETKPVINNFRCTSNVIDNDISFAWESVNQNWYEIQLYQNETLSYTYAGVSANKVHTIPKSYFQPNYTYRVVLKLAFIPTGYTEEKYYTYSDTSEINVTPAYANPTITNLNNIGDYYEKAITVNWRSEYQTGYEYECYYNNVKVKNGTGTTAQTFSIPANTFAGTLPASVRVRVVRSINGQTLYSSWQERSISLKEITPTLTSVNLSGSNIDLPITVSWVSTDQQNYEVKIEKDTTTVKTYTGTTATSVIVPSATLTTGLHKVSVRVAYSGRWTEWKTITATLIETLPSIGAFEPDGVIVERDNPIRLWWTSNNQSKWKVVIDNTLTYTGTTTKEHILPPATLTTGTHNMTLTVTYVTGAGVEKTATKQAEFIVQGKPPIPTITSSSTFTTNRPTITWDTQDQQGYILDVLANDTVIYTTEWQNGLVTSTKVMNYLANGTYTVRVKVMNQYALESDYGTMTITVNASVATGITLNTRGVEGGIYLWWDNDNTFDYFYVLRNGLPIAKVYDTIYTDYTAHNIESYTVRGITSEECYKDSQTVEAVYRINRSVVATVDRIEDIEHIVVMANNELFSGNLSVEASALHLSGRENPVTIFGEHATDTYNLKLVHTGNLFKLFEMFKRRQVFCYRDYLEKIYFTIQSLPYERDSRMIDYNTTINATKVDFKEVIAYD